jgi:hypothetical protein
MNKKIALLFAAGALAVAGCCRAVRTLEWKEGNLTMTEERCGSRVDTWETQKSAKQGGSEHTAPGRMATRSSLDLSRSSLRAPSTDSQCQNLSLSIPTSSFPSHRYTRWFVYIESEAKVWAYDGDRSLILDAKSASGPNSSGTNYCSRFPCAVPAEVFSCLLKQKQKEIQKHG